MTEGCLAGHESGLDARGYDVVRANHGTCISAPVSTAFCGAFTTYSALAVDVDLLLRAEQAATAVAYGLTTVIIGFVVCALGIWVGARRPRATA